MNPEKTEVKQILVVDDEPPIRKYLKLALRPAGFKITLAENGNQALEILKEKEIDFVITDMNMPGLNKIDLIRKIREIFEGGLIVITGNIEEHSYEEAIQYGANDFIEKPIKINEMVLRIKRVFRERALLQEKVVANEKLTSVLNELKESYTDTIQRLVLAAEYKDEDTGDHIIRMSRYCELLAEKAGLSPELVRTIKYAAPMHDVGKIGIPDNILMKPGKLTDEEYDIMKTHTTKGGEILANAKSDILKLAQKIALTHHEKWNGRGYPQGLTQNDIPISGRIVGLADVFDALTSRRPYKDPYPIEVAIDIIKKERGEHFDPELVDQFVGNMDSFLKIKTEIGGPEDVKLTDLVWSDRDHQRESLAFVTG